MSSQILQLLVFGSMLVGQDPESEHVRDAVEQFHRTCDDAERRILDALQLARSRHDAKRVDAELSAFLGTGELPLLASDFAPEFERIRREAFWRAVSAFEDAERSLRTSLQAGAAEQIDAQCVAFRLEHEDCLWSDRLVVLQPELGQDLLCGSWVRDGRNLVSTPGARSTIRLPVDREAPAFDLVVELAFRGEEGSIELEIPVAGVRYGWTLSALGPYESDRAVERATLEDGPRDSLPKEERAGDLPMEIAVTVKDRRVSIEVDEVVVIDDDASRALAVSNCHEPAEDGILLTSAAGASVTLSGAVLRVHELATPQGGKGSGVMARPRKSDRRSPSTSHPERSLPRKSTPELQAKVGDAWRIRDESGSMRDAVIVEFSGDFMAWELEGEAGNGLFRAEGTLRGRTFEMDDLKEIRQPRGLRAPEVLRPRGSIRFNRDGGLSVRLNAQLRRPKRSDIWTFYGSGDRRLRTHGLLKSIPDEG
jgi:hypothetical protein